MHSRTALVSSSAFLFSSLLGCKYLHALWRLDSRDWRQNAHVSAMTILCGCSDAFHMQYMENVTQPISVPRVDMVPQTVTVPKTVMVRIPLYTRHKSRSAAPRRYQFRFSSSLSTPLSDAVAVRCQRPSWFPRHAWFPSRFRRPRPS